MAVMTGYNRIEGQFAAENYDLNTDVLRGEWGFEGMVMSEWGGSHDAMATLYSGNDLISPGNRPQDVIDRLITVTPSSCEGTTTPRSTCAWVTSSAARSTSSTQ